MALVKTLGVVIRRMDLGEADRLLTLLTERYGKLKAVARGCRRPKSRLGGNLEPLVIAEFLLWKREGRDLAIVRSAEMTEHFPSIPGDLRAFVAAQFAAEMLDRGLAEEEPHPRFFSLLTGFLRSLRHPANAAASLLVFTVRVLDLLGYGVRPDRCAACLRPLPPVPAQSWMEYGAGGVTCPACARASGSAGERLTAEVSEALRTAAAGGKARTEAATAAVRALDRMLGYHQDRRILSSQRMLDTLASA